MKPTFMAAKAAYEAALEALKAKEEAMADHMIKRESAFSQYVEISQRHYRPPTPPPRDQSK